MGFAYLHQGDLIEILSMIIALVALIISIFLLFKAKDIHEYQKKTLDIQHGIHETLKARKN